MSTQNVPGDKEMWKVMLAASGSSQVKWTVIVMIVIIIISTAAWIYSKSKYKEKHCDIIKDVYTDMGKVSSINLNDANYKGYLLRDYYVKTAYNCCASGQFKNDFVGLCALRTCINQGARCLDFEIYSIDDQPVIAASSINDFKCLLSIVIIFD